MCDCPRLPQHTHREREYFRPFPLTDGLVLPNLCEDGEHGQGHGLVGGGVQQLVEASKDLLVEEVGAVHEGQHLKDTPGYENAGS